MDSTQRTVPLSSEETGIALIARERQRQIEKEGWSAEHDDSHKNGELAEAGAAYALVGKLTGTTIRTVREVQIKSSRVLVGIYDYGEREGDFSLFPWDEEWWKPSDDQIRNLTKAGALIAADIDRLLRAKSEPLISSGERSPSDSALKAKPGTNTAATSGDR